MPRRKTTETITVNSGEPMERCIDCVHWHRPVDPNDPDAVDFSSGSCDHNGYSKVPPLFTCNAWESGNGTIYDNIHKNI